MKAQSKFRIDQILVQKGLALSRERAQAMVLAGQVLVNEHRVEKPSQIFELENIQLRLKGLDHPYVSRGGLKLAGACEHFKINPQNKTCLDVGASTGGFTDYLLQHGAHRVYTLDSGTKQLHYRLRQDERVVVREKFNARYIKAKDLPEPIDLIVVDVSFISLKLMIPPLLKAVAPPWELVTLIKPQFEVGRERVEKGGLVKNEAVQQEVVQDLVEFTKGLGLMVHGVISASIKGDKGNQEFLMYASFN